METEEPPMEPGDDGSEEVPQQDRALQIAIGLEEEHLLPSALEAARWTLANHDWKALGREVEEAVEGYDPPGDVDLDAAQEILEEVVLAGEEGLALVTCPRGGACGERLREVWGRLDTRSFEYLRERGDTTEIITFPCLLDEFLDGLGPEAQGYAPLSEIALCEPHDMLSLFGHGPPRTHLEAVLELAIRFLAEQGIEVPHARAAHRCAHLLVPAHQAVRAVAMIDGLARQLGASASDGGDHA